VLIISIFDLIAGRNRIMAMPVCVVVISYCAVLCGSAASKKSEFVVFE
jgi:hypothetical protein